jgi:glutamyl-Q tRNA(Asp) synthetase
VNAAGQKLSKQTFAPPLDVTRPLSQLWTALQLLGQKPPAELQNGSLANLWEWALHHWNPAALPQQPYISLDETSI